MILNKISKEKILDLNNIPKHIAFIMDGNGRWAKKRGMPRTYGHHEGTKNIRELALEGNKIGIEAMTVYAFSTENFSRPTGEVDYIFKLPKKFFDLYLKELIDNNVQIRFIGHPEIAPRETREIIFEAVNKTKNNTGLILCFAFIYGAKSEILEAVKEIAEDYKNGNLEMEDISEELFDSYLMTGDLPEVDLLIRTSGEQRLSNYLLWQLAYSEMYFSNKHWPDFNVAALYDVLLEYQQRERRFGGLKK